MDDDRQGLALQINVPITDEERAHSRQGSEDRLLDQNRRPAGDSSQLRRDSDTLPPEPLNHPAFRDTVRPSDQAEAPYDPPRLSQNVPPAQETPPQHYHQPNERPQTTRTGYAPVQRLPRLWRPFWLRETVLAGFVVIFVLLLTVCPILWHLASDEDGFAVAKSTSHLTWTYAPTAVLVILVALWRQVDYHCKAVAPWAALRKGDTTASQSILLDYLSVIQFNVIAKAISHGHWAVVASSTSFAILKLMTIFATGLFILLPSNLSDLADSQQRLRVEPISLWLLVAGLCLLIISTLTVIFSGHQDVVSQDPRNLTNTAAILTRSNDLQFHLQKHGISSQARQKSALAGFMFRSSVALRDNGQAPFKIMMHGSETGTKPPDQPGERLKWWHPLTLSYPFLIATLVFPLLAIIALQILQDYSNNHNGILDLAHNRIPAAYGHYIPALITLLIATCYNSLDFNISLFSPYSMLRKGNAPASQTIATHLLGKLPPFALFSSLRTQNFSAALAIFAAMLASVTTIVVSGLYTVEASNTFSTADVIRTDTFFIAWPNSVSSDAGAATQLSGLEHNAAQPFPAFVDGALAFPQFEFTTFNPPLHNSSNSSTSYIKTLPALRANLRCEVQADSAFAIVPLSSSTSLSDPDSAIVTVRAPLPVNCQLGGTSGATSFVVYQNSFDLPTDGSDIFAGQLLDLRFGVNASSIGNFGEFDFNFVGDNPAVGCPSLAFTFGKFRMGSSDQTDVTTMVCYQEIEAVNATVTITNATTGATIDQSVTPMVDEANAVLVVNPQASSLAGQPSFDWRIQQNLENGLDSFQGNGVTASMDKFFQAVVAGRTGVAPQKLVGTANQQTLQNAVNAVYGRYMALVISDVMRTACQGSDCGIIARQSSGSNLGQIQVTDSALRLHQDNTSKIALQVLLGLMVGFGALAFATTRMRKLVPVNICTIAGQMGLLAGSELCYSSDLDVCECCGKPRTQPGFEGVNSAGTQRDGDMILRDGAEWMSTARLQRMFTERRMRFTLGWWRERPELGKRRRFGIDIGTRADGADDQDWELGPRGGGVEGRGLGWGAFEDREGLDVSGGLGIADGGEDVEMGQGRGGREPFQRFKSLRGPGGDGRGEHLPIGERDFEDLHSEEGEEDLGQVDSRRVRWAQEDEVRVFNRRSEDGASSIYSGEGYGHDPTSFRRRSQNAHGLGLNMDGEA